MTTIKQRIRMFAQWATAVGDISSTLALKSVANSDHKIWMITVDDFKLKNNVIKVMIIDVGKGQYQIKSLDDHVLWTGVPSDTNFNLAMQSSLEKLVIK